MKKTSIQDAKPYHPPGHQGMVALRLQDKELSGSSQIWMGLSHFLPMGGAEWAYKDSPTEKIYFVLEGEITVQSETETFILKKYDSIYLPPFESRLITNQSNFPASILVTITYPA